MAETGLTRFPVVSRDDPQRLVGMISLADLLRARRQKLSEERTRERMITLRFPIGQRDRRPLAPIKEDVADEIRV